MKALKRLILSAGLLFTTQSNAGLVEFDTYTYDDKSNLSWLDLSYTDGYSYNFVKDQLGLGGLFEGWRFASSQDVTDLVLNHVGFTPANYYSGNTEASLKELIGLIGYSYDGRDYSNEHNRYFAFAVGYVDSQRSQLAQIRQFGYKAVIGGYYRPENDGQWNRQKDSGINSHASFLIRDGALDPLPVIDPQPQYTAPVPTTNSPSLVSQVSVSEPQTLTILFSALLIVLMAKRMRT